MIVDTREFQSQLPMVLHGRGMHIAPLTLDVGDYVISADACIERKAHSDLAASLNGGLRLIFLYPMT